MIGDSSVIEVSSVIEDSSVIQDLYSIEDLKSHFLCAVHRVYTLSASIVNTKL